MSTLDFPYVLRGRLNRLVVQLILRWNKEEILYEAMTWDLWGTIRKMIDGDELCQLTVVLQKKINKELTPNNSQLDLILLHPEDMLAEEDLFACRCYINVPQIEGASYLYELDDSKIFFLCGRIGRTTLLTSQLPEEFSRWSGG